MKVEALDSTIYLNQEKYINDIPKKFEMKDTKPATTPVISKSVKSVEDNSNESFKDKSIYMSLVGSLIYTSVVTRPDIAFAVNKAGQAMSNPTFENWIEAKRI